MHIQKYENECINAKNAFIGWYPSNGDLWNIYHMFQMRPFKCKSLNLNEW